MEKINKYFFICNLTVNIYAFIEHWKVKDLLYRMHVIWRNIGLFGKFIVFLLVNLFSCILHILEKIMGKVFNNSDEKL